MSRGRRRNVYLKIMGRPPAPAFIIVEVIRASFVREGAQAFVDYQVAGQPGERSAITDRAFVLNERGETIDSFAAAEARPQG